MPSSRKKIVVLYHADCSDGFGAACAAWKKFGSRATYIAVPPGNRIVPHDARNAEVYTLDYSFPEDVLPAVLKQADSLTVVDHHITNERAATLATQSLFALDHSGAVLSWMYFHPDEPVPKLLAYIEDQDLWRFKLPHTRELLRTIQAHVFDFAVWNKLLQNFQDPVCLKKYIETGSVLLAQMGRMVEKLVEHAEEVRFEGMKCLMVNSPVHVSEIGAALVAKGSPIGIIWSRRDNKIIVSLRSRAGGVDVAKVAQKYGGGGHKSASGFAWEEAKFLTFRRKGV